MKEFDSVLIKKPSRNVFNLSHDRKMSVNFDKLYPFLCQEVYPDDTFNCRAEVFMRSQPLFAPIMHNVDMYLYFIFVPNRIVFNERRKFNWETFITGGEDGTAQVTLPYFKYEDLQYIVQNATEYGFESSHDACKVLYEHKSLIDYMGLPSFEYNAVRYNEPTRISALPFRAYQLAWNELFRNQNLQNEVEFSRDSGHVIHEDLVNILSMRYKCWEKDYFTSCLPWAQRGQVMTLPINTELAELQAISDSAQAFVNGSGHVVSDKVVTRDGDFNVQTTGSGFVFGNNAPASTDAYLGSDDNTVAVKDIAERLTITGLSVGTINEFRYNLRLQQWLENNARCGSRYIEQLLAHFGVTSSDARLQRPELLGGGKIPLIVSDVEQTSQSTDQYAQGNLAGKGTMYGKTGGFRKRFEEHGWLLGICCIIPRTSYQQGIPRQFTRMDKTEFYWPEFAHLGEQAVLNREVYYDPNPLAHGDTIDVNEQIFGYQSRFAELRYIPSTVHGDLRDTLDYWHMGRIFDGRPKLNAKFVEANTQARCFALDDVRNGEYDPFVLQIHNDIKAVRPLPKYAIPTL